MDRLSELLGHHVQFSYTALDRIVLNGYIERLQRPANLVYLFHEVLGVACIEPAVLSQRTDRYRSWLRTYTAELEIPVLPAPKGERKEDLVLPYYRRLGGAEGVACVLTSMEQGRTFVSYAPRFPSKSGDSNYRIITNARKQFLHYYFYVLDPVMGPMSLRVASYLPFNVTCYLNGHSFIAQELRRPRIGSPTASSGSAATTGRRSSHPALVPRNSARSTPPTATASARSNWRPTWSSNARRRSRRCSVGRWRSACSWAGRTRPPICLVAASTVATGASSRRCSIAGTRAIPSCALTIRRPSSSSTKSPTGSSGPKRA